MSSLTLPGRTSRLALLVILSFLSLTAVRANDAKPFLHPLFTDNMVLQRGISDPVWGWTTPGATVTVRIANKGAKAVAGPDGKWMAKLPPLPVGGPYTMAVTGQQTVTLNNVLVGDVWICSGQSDMSFAVGQALNGPAEIAAANYPQIRLFNVPNVAAIAPLSQTSSQWLVCSPQTISQNFSAVGYFFVRDLQQNIHIPIGLIDAAWSGTAIESWTSAEALAKVPEVLPQLADFEKMAQAEKKATYDQIMELWYAKHDPGSLPGNTWADPALDTSAWKTINQPTPDTPVNIPLTVDQTLWFRRDFILPAAWAGKDLMLHMGPVMDEDTTYINGTRVGGEPRYWMPHDYKVPASLMKPGRNVIAERVLNFSGGGGMRGKPEDLHIEPADDPTATSLVLAGTWLYKAEAPTVANDPSPRPIDNDSSQVTTIYNGMIAPLTPFAIKGLVWYQGESNRYNARLYQTLLPTMIGDWRSRFGVGNFPFLIVQIVNFGQPLAQPGQSNWAELREAQLLTSERVPNTGLAVGIDIGEANDLHPRNKQEVGRRLALAAEGLVYGQKIEYSGPIYQSMTVEGSTIRLHFTHLGGGLVTKGADKLTGFAIAGADGKFVWADANIDGSTVVVSSPTVPAPTAVRYAWADNPICNLYNKAGLPVVPFRTDSGMK